MATEQHTQNIQKILNRLAEIRQCGTCGTTLRFGDLDCPHCGADIARSFCVCVVNKIDLFFN